MLNTAHWTGLLSSFSSWSWGSWWYWVVWGYTLGQSESRVITRMQRRSTKHGCSDNSNASLQLAQHIAVYRMHTIHIHIYSLSWSLTWPLGVRKPYHMMYYWRPWRCWSWGVQDKRRWELPLISGKGGALESTSQQSVPNNMSIVQYCICF